MRYFLILLLALPAFSAVTVHSTSIQATSKEIVFTYTAPSTSACTIKASRVNDFGAGYAPVDDVDTAKFASSNSDTRNAALNTSGTFRTFILGKDVAERALDNYVYSRALKAATAHYIQITCGAETATFAATTKTVPFGLTRGEALPADAANPGEYLHPSRKWNISGQKVVDPETGTELSFPEAAGNRSATTATVAFKDAVGTSWTTPSNALADDAAVASIASNNTDYLFLKWNQDAASFGDATFASYDGVGVDYFQVSLKGSGTGAATADRTVTVYPTFDNLTPIGTGVDVVLPATEGVVVAGTGVSGDQLQTTGAKPHDKHKLVRRSGTFTYVAATKIATFVSGTTSEDWKSGTKFRVFESSSFDVANVVAGTPPTVTTTSAHGYTTGDTITLAGVTGTIASSVNGAWTITVTSATAFTLNGVTATGAYSSASAVCARYNGSSTGALTTAPGAPPTIHVPNSNWLDGTKARFAGFTDAGWTSMNGNFYTLASISGVGTYEVTFTATGASTTGTYAQTSSDSPDCTTAGLNATATRLTGVAQKYTDYSISTVDSATQITLSTGPASDITVAQSWAVDAFGFLVKKKTASADTVSIQYASATYRTSAGTSWPAGGGPICSIGIVTGPGGKSGQLCYFGDVNVFISLDGTTISAYNNIRPHEENTLWSQGSDCVGNLYGDNMGIIGVNPNYPNRMYCRPFTGQDRYFVIGDYTGDYRTLDPTKGYGSLYPSYAGYPVVPNCNGFNGRATDPPVTLPSGTPCVSYTVVTSSMKSTIENYGNQLWRKMATTIGGVNCVADENTLGAVWNPTLQKMHISIKCNTGQDTAGITYIWEVDDAAKTINPIAEIASWARNGTRWSMYHGGTGPVDYSLGRVEWTPHPMNVYLNPSIQLDSTGTLSGPWLMVYTSVNGNSDVDMTASGANGLQSCATWSSSPYLPTPTPDGTTLIDGQPSGCTTVTVDGEPYDDTLGATEASILAADTATHLAKTGASGRKWLQDIQVGDMLLHYNASANNYKSSEYMQVISKTGSGPGMTLVLWRGGGLKTLQNDSTTETSQLAPQTHTGRGRKLLAWMEYTTSNGFYPKYYVNYLSSALGPAGGERLDFSPGHGQIRLGASVGSAGNNNYGISLGDFATVRRFESLPAFTVPQDVKFHGRQGQNNLISESHVTYVDGAGAGNKYDYMIDGRPWNGYTGSPPDGSAPISGTTGVYKWAAATWGAQTYTTLYPKHLPTMARAQKRVIRSISGPGSSITDATTYTFCYAFVAGECRATSVAGDFYMSVPRVTTVSSVAQSSGADASASYDMAFTHTTSVMSKYTQTLLTPLSTGTATRALTSGFDNYRVEDSYKNWSVTSTGTTGVGRTRGLEGVKSEVFTVEMPPISLDSWDRTRYIPMQIGVRAFPGANQAAIEFGYAKYGNPSSGQYYCMDRLDACRTKATPTDTNPFDFGVETVSATSCTSGCTIDVPVVGNRILYYRVKYYNSGSLVSTGAQQVMVTP